MPYARNCAVNIYYEVEGQGEPLMIIHGLTRSLEDMKEAGYAETLQEDFQVILVDLRGHGKSDKPHNPEDYTAEKIIGDVLAVQDDLGLTATHILGYSYGGGIAFECAVSAPDRVMSLIVGGAGMEKPPAGIYEGFIRQLEAGPEALVAALEMAEAVPEAIKTRIMANDHRAIIALCRATMSSPSSTDDYYRITVPVLLFAGEYDPAYPSAKETGERLPNAQFISLPGLDHVQAGTRVDLLLPHIREFMSNMF
jgi:pimeloyl-ACP methyl ester carboxylesterase